MVASRLGRHFTISGLSRRNSGARGARFKWLTAIAASVFFMGMVCAPDPARADSEVLEIIKRSVVSAESVRSESKGRYREAAFTRLPPRVVFHVAGEGVEKFKPELLPRLRLLGMITSVDVIEATNPTNELNIGVLGLADFTRRIREEGAQVLTSTGMSADLADTIARTVRQDGAAQCSLTRSYDERGFIQREMLLIDTGAGTPDLSRLRCMTSALIGMFGLVPSAQENTAEVSQLLALQIVYHVPTNAPFDDLTLQRLEASMK